MLFRSITKIKSELRRDLHTEDLSFSKAIFKHHSSLENEELFHGLRTKIRNRKNLFSDLAYIALNYASDSTYTYISKDDDSGLDQQFVYLLVCYLLASLHQDID